MFVNTQQSSKVQSVRKLVQEGWSAEAFGTKVKSPGTRSQEALSDLDKQTKRVGDRREADLMSDEEESTFPSTGKQLCHRRETERSSRVEKKLERQVDLVEKQQSRLKKNSWKS